MQSHRHNILVYGTNIHDHDQNLMQVLDRIRQINLSLNAQICKFRLHEVKYVGNVFTSQGLLPDDEKSRPLRNSLSPRIRKLSNVCSEWPITYQGISQIMQA